MMNKKTSQLLLAVTILFSLSNAGCASVGKTLKAWISGRDHQTSPIDQIATPRFSEQDNLKASSDKQYRRMNRQRFEEESDLRPEAGSLWVMEGQGAYLFAQNQMRMVGDLLNVRIEGSPRAQLQTKSRVITRLLDRLDNPVRGLASQGATQPEAPPAPAPQAPNNDANNQRNPAGQNEKAEGASPQEAGAAAAGNRNDPMVAVQTVPTRIVEQLKDGSYRVRGMQPFMIGKREYRVIVTGIVRPEDFDDAGIDSSKLLDAQFDIVSSKKGASL
jgi:flagellar L-ring protein FlgH